MAIDWVLAPIDLEERILAVAIDFVARRVLSWAFELLDVRGLRKRKSRMTNLVTPRDVVRVHVLETELANIQNAVLTVFLRIRCSMPCFDLPTAEVDAFDFARSSSLLRRSHRLVMSIKCGLLLFPFLLSLDAGIVERTRMRGIRFSGLS